MSEGLSKQQLAAITARAATWQRKWTGPSDEPPPGTPETPCATLGDVHALLAEVERLTAERDEAQDKYLSAKRDWAHACTSIDRIGTDCRCLQEERDAALAERDDARRQMDAQAAVVKAAQEWAATFHQNRQEARWLLPELKAILDAVAALEGTT